MIVDMLMLEVLLSSPLPLVALLSVYRLLDRRSCTNHSSASGHVTDYQPIRAHLALLLASCDCGPPGAPGQGESPLLEAGLLLRLKSHGVKIISIGW